MRENSLSSLIPIVEAIARLLMPHAEVVLHDLAEQKIFFISNCFSKRRIGDSSLAELADLDLHQSVIGPYPKTNWDGRRLKSVSAVIRDGRKRAVGLLCVNQDIEAFAKVADQLANLFAVPMSAPAATSLFPGDWREAVNAQIGRFLQERRVTLAGLSAEDLNALLDTLSRSGVFEIRHAAVYIAKILEISRATLYQRLKLVRGKEASKPTRKGILVVKAKA